VLLRRLARRRLPAPLLSKPKHGFTAPIGRWIAGPHARQFRDDVFGAASAIGGLMDLAAVRRMFREHQTGARNHSYALWAIWMLERWHKLQSRPQPAAPAPVLVRA
jgi:asparagine synthase (glutamine-hydrolysing)